MSGYKDLQTRIHLRTRAERAEIARDAAEACVRELAEEVERYRRSIVAHHNIANLSEQAIKEGFGRPGGCPICEQAQKR